MKQTPCAEVVERMPTKAKMKNMMKETRRQLKDLPEVRRNDSKGSPPDVQRKGVSEAIILVVSKSRAISFCNHSPNENTIGGNKVYRAT
jgi:hypothetical protein